MDFRLVENGSTYLLILGIDDDIYEYELYEYGSEIVDSYRSMYFLLEAETLQTYDIETHRLLAKFIFKYRGRDPYISFAYIDINEISDQPSFYHNATPLELCSRKFVRAWDDIKAIDSKYYMYTCADNNYTYKYSYSDDGIHIEELFVVGMYAEQLL